MGHCQPVRPVAAARQGAIEAAAFRRPVLCLERAGDRGAQAPPGPPEAAAAARVRRGVRRGGAPALMLLCCGCSGSGFHMPRLAAPRPRLPSPPRARPDRPGHMAATHRPRAREDPALPPPPGLRHQRPASVEGAAGRRPPPAKLRGLLARGGPTGTGRRNHCGTAPTPPPHSPPPPRRSSQLEPSDIWGCPGPGGRRCGPHDCAASRHPSGSRRPRPTPAPRRECRQGRPVPSRTTRVAAT
jgi:hypothetical protein